MQLAHAAARHRVARSLAVAAALTAILVATAAAAPGAGASAATRPARTSPGARTADAAAPRKAVIVAGPVGSDTSTYKAKAEKIAKAAEKQGMQVIRIYTPHATWQRVVDAATGADLFVYIGHGNGWPSPHPPFQEDSKDGLGLNPKDTSSDNTTTKYYGANMVRAAIRFAPNAVVLLNHLCYSAGQGEEGSAIPAQAVAVERVDNFAAGFLAAGARTVFALRIQPGENLVNSLYTMHTTMDGFFMTRFGGNSDGTYKPYYGWVGTQPNVYRDSVRTPGQRIHLDPDHAVAGKYPGATKNFGYYRAVTGDLEMTTDEWLNGSGSSDQDPPVVTGLSAGQSSDTIPAGENAVPVFTPNGDGLSDTLTIHHTLSEPSYLDVSIARQDGSVVKHFTSWSEAGDTTTSWNGKNANGKVVADGKLDITVTPRDRAGNVGDARTVSVKSLTSMKSPRLAPSLFFPTDGDALAQASRQSVTLIRPATLRWRILDASGGLVRLGLDDQSFPAGVASWDWDGLDDAGHPAPQGTYTSIATATTDDGTYSHKLSLKLMPFNLKGKLKVSPGDKVKLMLLAAEPMKGYPTIVVKQPGRAAYKLYDARYSATKFTATWTVKAGASGAIRITVTGTDTGGGVQSKVFKGTLH